jgi:pimeloyl-ACP methyl ester carboxylesterase
MAIAFVFLMLNLIAYMHAHAMTHFSDNGTRTANPEQLTFWQKTIVLTGVNIPRPINRCTLDDFGMPFEVHQFSTGRDFSLEGWFIPCGKSQPGGIINLFHGYSGCKADVLREAAGFHEIGYATFLVDFRGSGGSSGNPTTLGIREADDVLALLNFVRARWPNLPVTLFGQSMGSAAVLRAVAEYHIHPECLILGCPFDCLLATVGNWFRSMNLPAFPISQLLVFWGRIQNGFNAFDHVPSQYARQVQCPVLMLHGELDTRATRTQADNTFEKLLLRNN